MVATTDEEHPDVLPPSDLGLPYAILGLVIPHALCTVIVLARLVARVIFLRKWFLDDTMIVFAYLFATATAVIYSFASQRPDVLHADETAMVADLDPDKWVMHPYILRTYLGLLFYQVTLCLTKLSILTFYLRLFSSSRKYRRVVWLTIIWVIAYGIPMLFMSIFQCHPSAGKFFGKKMACFQLEDLLIASTTFHTLTDSWLILMIMPSISGLDIPRKPKIVLSIVLNFGVFVITAGVVRLMLSLRKDYRPDIRGVTNSLAFFVMTVLEADLAIICASAPTLRPIFAGVAPWIMADPRRKSLQPVAQTRGRRRFSGPEDNTASANLTSRVSYNGYPWTEPATSTPGAGSRDTSTSSRLNRLTKKPPVAQASNLGQALAAAASKKGTSGGKGSPLGRTNTVTSDGRPILGGDDDSRPASMAQSGSGDENSPFVFGGALGSVPGTAPLAPLGGSPRSPGFRHVFHQQQQQQQPRYQQPQQQQNDEPSHLVPPHHDWRHSEESLVMGLNDPAMGPTALSPAPAYNPQRHFHMAAPERVYGGPATRWDHDAERGRDRGGGAPDDLV